MVVAWLQELEGRRRVTITSRATATSGWTRPALLSAATRDAELPDMDITTEGAFALAWLEHETATRSRIRVTRGEVGRARVTTSVAVQRAFVSPPEVGRDAHDDIVVTWLQGVDSPRLRAWVWRGRDGSAAFTAEPPESTSQPVLEQSVTVRDDGLATLVWTVASRYADYVHVFARQLDIASGPSGGVFVAGPTSLTPFYFGRSSGLQTARNAQDDVVVAWRQEDPAGNTGLEYNLFWDGAWRGPRPSGQADPGTYRVGLDDCGNIAPAPTPDPPPTQSGVSLKGLAP